MVPAQNETMYTINEDDQHCYSRKKNSRSLRVMFYKRKIFLVRWSTPLTAPISSAVCGTTCGCRYARDPSSSQSVRVKWKKRRLSVLCNTPFLPFSPKDAACANKTLLARSPLNESSIVAFPMTLASVYMLPSKEH